MNDFEVFRNISRPVKGLIVVMLVLAFIVLLIPLWQIGSSSSLSYEIAHMDSSVVDMEAEGRALKAAIAAGMTADEEFLVSASSGYQNQCPVV